MDKEPTLNGNMTERVIERTLQNYPQLEAFAREALNLSGVEAGSGDFDELVSLLAGARVSNVPSGLEQVRSRLMVASADFAYFDCRAPRHENWMSGSLESRLVSAFSATADYDGPNPGLWAADLLGSRETETGGDMAIFLEADGRFVALLLQAKRTLHTVARGPARDIDIRRPRFLGHGPNGERIKGQPLWQLERLQKLWNSSPNGLSAAYLFYDNAVTANPEPNLPIVADLGRCYKHASQTGRVRLDGAGVCDLGTYAVLAWEHRGVNVSERFTMEDVVRVIVGNDVPRILAVSPDEGFGYRLDDAFSSCSRSVRVTFSRIDSRPTAPASRQSADGAPPVPGR